MLEVLWTELGVRGTMFLVDLSWLVLREDARCAAFGRVVSSGGRVTFEPPLPIALPYYRPGRQPAPRPSGLGVSVHGVDPQNLLDRRDKDGAYEGWATLSGVWRDGHVHVDHQGAQWPTQPPVEARWVTPPCPEPSGGWPTGDRLELPAVHEALVLAGALVATTMFQPIGRGAVLVVAATDPQRVADALIPLLGGRVCIVSSRYTAQEVNLARQEIARHFKDWQGYISGTGSDPAGQVLLTLELVRVLPDLVERALNWPERLVAVQPWLTPIP